ncbi:hypothetical protein FACS1894142_2010 [Spirochaetia bacterium]|nr:hypothetical protein FACS1894142_2010 [Spirochaetia bacterium]
MVSLEQIKLLETRVSKVIDIVNRVTEENTYLKEKLDTYQTRIDELEIVVQRFRDDQGRIEDGILSALDRLSAFEKDIEQSLSPLDNIKTEPGLPADKSVGSSAFAERPSRPQAAEPAVNSPVVAEKNAPVEDEADDLEGEDLIAEADDDAPIYSLKASKEAEFPSDAGLPLENIEGLTDADTPNTPDEAVDSGELDIF